MIKSTSKVNSIVLEGGEGSGKGTAIRLLRDRLISKGDSVVTTRSPGGVPICEGIRNVILGKNSENMEPLTEMFLYAACHAQLMKEKITPILMSGKTILIDRFVYSSYVYQGIVEGLGIDFVEKISNIAINNWHPDIVFYLNVDPEIGLKRIFQNNLREVNRFDLKDIEFHQKIREGYLSLAQKYDYFIVIDASKSPEEIVDEMINCIDYVEKQTWIPISFT